MLSGYFSMNSHLSALDVHGPGDCSFKLAQWRIRERQGREVLTDCFCPL
jgi:ketosteroid isomerase-like protein